MIHYTCRGSGLDLHPPGPKESKKATWAAVIHGTINRTTQLVVHMLRLQNSWIPSFHTPWLHSALRVDVIAFSE